MKNIFYLVAVVILLPTTALANSFQFETIRTTETPGFFAMRLFADESSTPLDIQNVFIKNFINEEVELYADILLVINELGSLIITPEEIKPYRNRANHRFIFLGEPSKNALNFKITNKETALEDFEKFSLKNLGPVFFQNATLTFGGNVTEVYPKIINHLGAEPVLLIGKFETPMQTLAQITATSTMGEITANAILDLREYYDDPVAQDLPDMWQELAAPSFAARIQDIKWLSLFPWIIGGAGFSLIFWSFWKNKSKRHVPNTVFPSKDPRNPDPENLEDSIPFHVVGKNGER